MAKQAYEATTNQSETDVATPSPEWEDMEVYRELPRDLRAGTIGIQHQVGKHLWQAPRERDKDIARGLKALQFEPFYWSSAELIGGQPFTQMIGFSDDTPPEIQKWNKRSIFGHWFMVTSGQHMKMVHVDHPESWRVDAQTCAKENSEAFAGLHAANSTPFYIYDGPDDWQVDYLNALGDQIVLSIRAS